MENEKVVYLFIIEDDGMYASALNHYLQIHLDNFKYNVSVRSFKTSESCLEAIAKDKTIMPDIIVLDYYLNSSNRNAVNGLSALLHLKIVNPEAQIIFLSSQNKINLAVETMHAGAYDYIVKDKFAFQNVLNSLQRCLFEMKSTGKLIPDYSRKSASL